MESGVREIPEALIFGLFSAKIGPGTVANGPGVKNGLVSPVDQLLGKFAAMTW